MKWLAGAMQGLFVAVVGAILLAIFQEPIAQRFRNDRVEAMFEMGPWMAYPTQSGTPPAELLTASGFSDLSAQWIVREDDEPVFARVTLVNKTSNVVKNLRMRFRSPMEPYAYFEGTDAKWTVQENASEVALPDLAPGERKRLYLWEPLGFYEYSIRGTETYSSAGAFRLTFSQPESLGARDRESSFDRFMEDWFWWIFVILTALFLLGAFVMSIVWSGYAKALLKSDDLYLAEKVRFDQDPKKFQPDYAAAGKVDADQPVNTSP